jgi:hypothetical protein
MTTQTLMEFRHGISVGAPFAERIAKGEATSIIKSKLYKNCINKLMYLVQGDDCFGIIKLHCPEKISMLQFEDNIKRHTISNSERDKWWPNKQILFEYGFDTVNIFPSPKKIKNSYFNSDIVYDFEFMDEEELIKDVGAYDPTKMSDSQLADDWRIVSAWYSTKKTGGNIKYSVEDISALACKIYPEIVSRVKDGKMKHDFDIMQKYSRELYDLVSKQDAVPTTSTLKYEPIPHMLPQLSVLDISEATELMFEEGDKYAVEKKLSGNRVALIKQDGEVKLYSGNVDISEFLKTIIGEANHISAKDVILDCELVYKNGSKDEVAKYLSGGLELNEGVLSLHCFDIIREGSTDLTSLPWYERKKILHSLNFSKHIEEVHSIIVSNKEDAGLAIKLLRTLSGSEGAMIKKYDSLYLAGQESNAWIKFLNKQETSGTFVPPRGAQDNAKKVLEWKERYGDDVKGMTRVGWTRASQLASGRGISIDIVKRMAQFNRHRQNSKIAPGLESTPWKDAGYVAWQGWGGDEGIDWAIRISQKENSTTTDTPGISEVQGKIIKEEPIEQVNRG